MPLSLCAVCLPLRAVFGWCSYYSRRKLSFVFSTAVAHVPWYGGSAAVKQEWRTEAEWQLDLQFGSSEHYRWQVWSMCIVVLHLRDYSIVNLHGLVHAMVIQIQCSATRSTKI